jgi:uncharacterized protein YndB with AHSA1/START domain
MHGPDGTDYPNVTKYFEVERHKRLVYDHGGSRDRPAMFRVTVTFAEVNGKTKMGMTMTHATSEAAEETRKIVKKHGGESTWDRLAEYLEKESSGKEAFVITRAFDAPIDVMFEMWTNPEHFSRWLPPTGAEMAFLRADIRPGGSSFYVMTGLHGKMYGRATYHELRKPDRVVYTQQFCDENEKPARHPMMATFPESMRTTVTLAEEGPGRTRVTVRWEPEGTVSREEIETFVKARAGMTGGWTGSLDKLEACLAEDQP